MDSIYWYATPAFVALIVKLWLIVKSDKRSLILNNWSLALFFLAISIVNIIEVITYTADFSPAFYPVFIKLYNGSIFLSICYLLIFSGYIAEINLFKNSKFPLYYSTFSAILFVLIVTTDWFISGYETVGYGFTRIPGEYYQILPILLLVNLSFSFMFLVFGYSRSRIEQVNKRKCKAILASYLPFMICLLIIVLLMQMGVKITGAVIIPFTTTYLIVMLVLSENKNDLFKLLSKTPFTNERKTLNGLVENLQEFLSETSMGNNMDLKELSNNIEKQLIAHAVNANNGNQAHAAKILGISPSSICRKK